jgi:hypothetical protein
MNVINLSRTNGFTNTKELAINLIIATKSIPGQKVFNIELKRLTSVMTGSPCDALRIAIAFSFSNDGSHTLLNFLRIRLAMFLWLKRHMSSVFNGLLYPLRIIPLNHQKVIFDKNEAESSGQAFYKIENLSMNKGIN